MEAVLRRAGIVQGRLLHLGQITAVTVPAPEIEAVRDLVRARDVPALT